MANNVTLDPGSGGDTIRTKDRAGVETQIVGLDLTPGGGSETLMDGSLPVEDTNSADLLTALQAVQAALEAVGGLVVNLAANNDVTVTGSVTANAGTGPWPVTDNGGSLTVDGSVTANAGTNLNTSALALEAGGNLAGAATSLAIMDDWDESDRAKVNLIAGQAGVQGASGAVSATTQRVVLATDVALPAGTNAIGKLAANSGVDIGDVDVTSVPAPLNVVGTGTEAAAQRVTIATDSTGVLSVDDNGGNLSIDDGGNSITVDYATTGSGTATGALRVELPTNGTGIVGLAAGTNGIGKLTANSGVDIGDVDVTTVGTITPGTAATALGKAEDAVHASGDVGVMSLAVRADTAASTAANGDYVPLITNSAGAQWTQLHPATTGGTTLSSTISAASTNATSVKGSAGVLYSIDLSNANAAARWFKAYNKATAPTVGSDTPVFRALIPAGGGRTISFPHGLTFGTGIAFALTTGAADADTGAVAASELTVNLGYA